MRADPVAVGGFVPDFEFARGVGVGFRDGHGEREFAFGRVAAEVLLVVGVLGVGVVDVVAVFAVDVAEVAWGEQFVGDGLHGEFDAVVEDIDDAEVGRVAPSTGGDDVGDAVAGDDGGDVEMAREHRDDA